MAHAPCTDDLGDLIPLLGFFGGVGRDFYLYTLYNNSYDF